MFSCYRDHTNQVGDTETERLDRLNMHGNRVGLAVRTIQPIDDVKTKYYSFYYPP